MTAQTILAQFIAAIQTHLLPVGSCRDIIDTQTCFLGGCAHQALVTQLGIDGAQKAIDEAKAEILTDKDLEFLIFSLGYTLGGKTGTPGYAKTEKQHDEVFPKLMRMAGKEILKPLTLKRAARRNSPKSPRIRTRKPRLD